MLEELPFSYAVVRSRKRRTAALMVDMGRVEVRVPALADADWIENWVRSKADWIVPKLESQARALEQHAILIEQGGRFTFDGISKALFWQRGARSGVEECESGLQLTLSRRVRRLEEEAIRDLLKHWMVEQAEQRLIARCYRLGERIGLEPGSVRVRDYRRKWGQCSARGEISLNWRLMHLSPELREYVLIHELCHLEQMNHSRAFWALVAGHCPDYRHLRGRLAVAYPYLIW